jgi:hypothetical protein
VKSMGAEEERRGREKLEWREYIYFVNSSRGIVNIRIVEVLL